MKEDLVAAPITGGEQGLLVANMGIQRALRGANIRSDLLERGRVDAFAVEEPRCGRENPPPLFFRDGLAVKDAESGSGQWRKIDRFDLGRSAPILRPAAQEEIFRNLRQARARHRLNRR